MRFRGRSSNASEPRRCTAPRLRDDAHGCVPVVPEHLRAVFGDVAVYYGEGTVAHAVDALWADQAGLRRRQQLARNFVQARLSAQNLARSFAPWPRARDASEPADHDKDPA
jgi:hypothetical protein